MLGLTFVLPLTINARQDRDRQEGDRKDKDNGHHEHNLKTPVGLVGVILVPGNPIISSDIAWVDPGTERYSLADRSNFGVDIIDAENDVYVARVTGMAGPLPSGGGTSNTNGGGPNGVLVTPNRQLWAGDGNSTAQVADIDRHSPRYLQIIQSVSTAIPACDSGATHYCGRADELGYDPRHHIILIANNAPLSVDAPHAPIDPYATFISAVPPYTVLGHISFPGAGGLEQPLWDSEIHRFFLTVPGKLGAGNAVLTPVSIAVINPTSMLVEKMYALNCQSLTGTTSVSTTGIALGAFQHLLVSACGKPIILNALNGHLINVINQVGGGDEVWYNPGDGRFYVTGADTSTAPVQSLGVIDAETSTWLQNLPDVRGKNPAAFAETNHIFTAVQITAAIAAAPATDNSTCSTFGFKGTGCIAVFTHSDER
ncbi:MAG: hypothetical protein DMG13_16175 [Acidobacteria bacterium]|nr:MAG: hypothetical protein DMG13_16175 [Acidobacteriota bacterium]